MSAPGPGTPHGRACVTRVAPVALLAVVALVSPLALAAIHPRQARAAARARTSLPAIERQVMCVTCKIPLNVAESQQANRERAFIQSLIDRGDSEAQVKDALVGQYGPTVLGLPATHGFDLAAYLVPAAVVLGLVALLAMLLPRWRRQASAGEDREPPPQPLSPSDAARLESDLARFD
jgi:cytochrome c-type biogenesis protein CcmH/NrfF